LWDAFFDSDLSINQARRSGQIVAHPDAKGIAIGDELGVEILQVSFRFSNREGISVVWLSLSNPPSSLLVVVCSFLTDGFLTQFTEAQSQKRPRKQPFDHIATPTFATVLSLRSPYNRRGRTTLN